MKWRDLEAQGVRRCCVHFVSGKQCRRRADEDGSWCTKHRPMMDKVGAENLAAIKAENNYTRPEEDDD